MDDKRLEDFGIRGYQDHDHQATPNYSHKTMSIPGMSGQWDFGTEIRSRPFRLFFKTTADNRSDLQRLLNEFVAFLHDEFGKPRILKVTFDYEPDKHYFMKVNEPITPERLMRANKYPVSFTAHDPYKYSNELSEDVVWGSETITFEYNYLLGHKGLGGSVKITNPQKIDIDVEGLAIQPVFVINGSANNLKISANGYSFGVPNFTDTDWEIDFEKYLVYKNGKETMLEIRKFFLLPGRNKIKIEGNNIDIDLRIKFRDKFN